MNYTFSSSNAQKTPLVTKTILTIEINFKRMQFRIPRTFLFRPNYLYFLIDSVSVKAIQLHGYRSLLNRSPFTTLSNPILQRKRKPLFSLVAEITFPIDFWEISKKTIIDNLLLENLLVLRFAVHNQINTLDFHSLMLL